MSAGERESRRERVAARKRQLEQIAPGDGLGPFMDRGAWNMMGQRDPGTWSWGRALGTSLAAIVLAVVLFILLDLNAGFLIGMVALYAFNLYRARHLHVRYLRRNALE